MSVLEVTAASRWFGNVVALNDVTMRIGPGVTGLLGPNGAGKSTLLAMLGGFLAPSAGTVTLDGEACAGNVAIYRRLGLVPEREGMYESLTGRALVLANARLHGLADPGAAATRALDAVEMSDVGGRRISTYSKGMKQRVKMATALVHDPAVLLLDEPFNGMDPRQRLQLISLLGRLGAEGRTVLFSSHILEEVEQLASRVEVVVAGRHAASGDFREIRRLMTERPHRYTIRSSDDRALAAALVADGTVSSVDLDAGGGLSLTTRHHDAFVHAVPRLAAGAGVRLLDLSPDDESLESVFAYLVGR